MHGTRVILGLCVCHIIISTAKEYFYDSSTRTWDNARIFCLNNHGGIATIITSADIQNARNKAGTNSWVGLYDPNQNDVWQWSDGTQCVVTNGHHCSDFWAINEPSPNNVESCVEFVVPSGQFNDKDCSTHLSTLCNIKTLNPTKYPTHVPTKYPTNVPTDLTVNPTVFPTLNPTNNPTTIYPTSQPTINPTIDEIKYEITYGVAISIHFEYVLVANHTKNDTETLLQNITKRIISEILQEQELTYCIQSDDYNITIVDAIENNITSTTIISTIFFCDNYERNTLSVVDVQQKLDTDLINKLNESNVLMVNTDSVQIEVDIIRIKGNEIKNIMSTTLNIATNTLERIAIANSNKNEIDNDTIVGYIVLAFGLLVIMLLCVAFAKKYELKSRLLKKTNMSVNMANIDIGSSSAQLTKVKTSTQKIEPQTDDIDLNEDENVTDINTDLHENTDDNDIDDSNGIVDWINTRGSVADMDSVYDKTDSVAMTHGMNGNKSVDFDDMYEDHNRMETARTPNTTITTSKGSNE